MKTKMNLARGGEAGASKKLLAAIAVLAVAFVVFAAIPAVDATGTGESAGAESTYAAKIGEVEYTTVVDAITAVEEGQTIVLQSNVTKSITISKNVTIDLNGFKLTNEASKATIVVESGKLIVNDSSTKGEVIQNGTGSYNAALFVKPGAKAELNGGFFNSTNDDPWYTIKNCGELTINDGVTVYNNSNSSSVIANGYFNFNDYNSVNSATGTSYPESVSVAKMIINGGAYTGKCYVKNDDYGLMTVNGGEFTISTIKGAALMNAGTMTIGSADGTGVPVFKGINSNAVVLNFDDPSNKVADPGLLTVNAVKADEASVLIGIASGYTFGEITLKDKNVWNGEIISVSNGTVLNGSLDIGGDKAVFADVKAGTNGISIKAGSVVITGDFTKDGAGSITVTGDAKITGDSTFGDGVVITVAQDATLTVAPGATLTVATPIVNNGKVSVAGTVSGTITNNGTVEKVNGGNLNGATINGGKTTEKTDDSDKENVNIDGTIKGTENTYDADQIVTINGDTRIVAGAVLTINGTLVVKEGVTLTLEAGSKLVIASNAIMDIQGTVVVEESYGVVGETGYVRPAEFEINGNVAVYGALNVNGIVTFVTGTVSVEQDGVVDILEEGKIAGTPAAYKFVVKASGTLNVAGSIATMEIENNGTVTFDSKVASGNITVDMKNGAALDVKNITLATDSSANGFIELKDEAANDTKISATAAGTKTSEATSITDNSNVYATISGISVSESVTSKTENRTTTYTYVMTVSGSASVSPIYLGAGEEPSNMAATATVELNGFATTSDAKSKLTIAEGLTVGENVTLENKGTLEVTAIIDATKGTVNNTGKITVTGSGSIVVKQEKISNDVNINASKYSVEGATSTDKTYYYVTLDNALAAAANGTTKDIKVLGEQTLAESAELVSGATLDITGATVVIGSGDNASDDVLTVRSGATVKGTPVAPSDGKAIDVKGTVSAENKRDIKTDATNALNAGAAVYSEEIDDRNRPVSNGWAKWTNVYTAMADSTLTVVKLINGITLDKNLTIPEGKTLDTDGENVTAEKNVVITVEGTLDIGAGSVISLKKVGDETASIVVKGLIESDNDLDTNEKVIRTSTSTTEAKYLPLGAYYTVDGKFCMTTVEKAAAVISTVDEQTITIKGTEDELTVAGDIAFAGKSADEKATVKVELSEITFSGSVSVDNAVIKFFAAAKVSGTFANASGSVALKGMIPATVTDATATGATAVNTLSVSSETKDGTAVLTVSGKLASITTTVGTSTTTEKQTFTVTGAVTVSAIDLENATVDGTLTVKGTNNTIATLTVNGSVVIAASGALNSTTATVLGSLVASEKTSAATDAVFNVNKLYVGTTKDAVGAAASVTGKVVLGIDDNSESAAFAVVAAGSTADAFTAEGSTFKSTAYYVDNGLFVTVYANATNTVAINNIKAEKDNAWFSAWKNDDGEPADDKTVGYNGFSKVTADFITEIFSVVVNADSAVDNLYIDGNLMTKNGTQFTLVGSKLVAGNHTFSYTLKNGYSGEGTFKILSEGKSTVSGNTLTLSGTPTSENGITVELQLTGFTASGYVDPTPVTPSEDKDDGLTVTDYLLIVLVVLIVIMAVIVAMRLMRS